MRRIETDILVIGAGPAGAACAWRLAQAGRTVTVAERGHWINFETLGRDAPDWERRRATTWSSNPNVRRGPDDYPVDDRDTPIKPMVGNAVGGGSVYWSAHVPRFRPEDFRTRTLDGVGDDWPITYGDLAAYYDINDERLGTARVPGDPSAAPSDAAVQPLPGIGAHGRRMARAFDSLGWHWWPVDLVVGRHAAQPGTTRCTHVGPCDLGCPSRIRSAMDGSYVRDALACGMQLLTGTRVLRLDHDASGHVERALCATDDGPLEIRARTFVVACNGMGTPRLLLASASPRFPDGLANGFGLVGRNLMLHPYGRVDGQFAEPLGGWAPGEIAGLVSFQFYSAPPGSGLSRGFKLQLTSGPPPGAVAVGSEPGQALPWGQNHHAAFASRFDHSCGFTVCAEDRAEPENRIVLSPDVVDADGVSAPKWIYRVSDTSRRALDFGLDRASEVLQAAGALETVRTPLRAQAGFHIMGTARMGDDPAHSVVDRFGRCHEVRNAFVVDASVFVTSAPVNPTATAQAFALRAADHILATEAA